MFSPANGPRIYTLERSIVNLKQGIDTIVKYFNTMKGLWDELAQLDTLTENPSNERRKVMKFLMGFNEIYVRVRSQILLMDLISHVFQAYSLLLQDESQRSIHNSAASEISALLANANFTGKSSKGGDKKNWCSHCNIGGHIKEKCLRVNAPRCGYCGIPGHNKEECYKLNGYPQNYRTKRNQGKRYGSLTED